MDSKTDRFLVLSKTLNCLKNSKSRADIDSCKDEKRKTIMQLIKYSSSNSVYQNFEKERRFLIENHNQKLKKSTVEKKSHILQNTIKCFEGSSNRFDLSMCKNNEEESLVSFAHSYEDNQKIQNSLNKDELINRYEIRIELARIDRMYDRVKMFSQTLSCFKNSSDSNDLKDCKSEEKKRIYNLIRS